MVETVIKIENLKKQYRLGAIGGRTLTADLQSWWARKRGKEDPNVAIGTDQSRIGDSFYALDGISMEVKKGEALGIIGANGAGKSTLLKLLSRVTAPTEGSIRIKGRIASMLEVGTGFHPELTGRENIYMNGAILGMTRAEIDRKIEDIIAFSECRPFIDTPVKRYSSGMYVKLAFAVAAHLDAEIMIMDEVLAVGDVKFQKKCLGRMGNAANDEGRTVLYVSHNMATIRQLCTRCVVLDHGRMIYDGDVEQAIAVYTGRNEQRLPLFYDFSDVKRPSGFHGQSLFVHSLRFQTCAEQAVYSSSESLSFEMEYTAHTQGDSVGVYYSILTEEDQPVGTAFSGVIAVTEKDRRKSCRLEMDLSELVAGVYHFYLDVFFTNEYGTVNSCDRPEEAVYFEVSDDGAGHKNAWPTRYFGHVRLAPIRVTGESGI